MTSKPVMRSPLFVLILLMLLFVLSGEGRAQTTAFTYQGKLTDSGNLANGTYDMQFKLFDTATVGTGTQQGTTLAVSNVTVTIGIFTVQLDFGVCAACFNGAARFLEIAVKPTSGGTFTTLGPRQPLTSAPYAIYSGNAATVGGIAATGLIQNTTTTQANTNFNISGNGTAGGTLSANLINTATQYNIGGSRVLGVDGTNLNTFAGLTAGISNSTGVHNSFFGANAGASNQVGGDNAFFGTAAGQLSTGFSNSFFGSVAGLNNTTGSENAFFGRSAGQSNTTGSNNAFFGRSAGITNTTGTSNAFFGRSAGQSNTTGSNNAFFGDLAGSANTASNNAFFGASAGFNNTTEHDNTFLGFNAGLNNGLTDTTNIANYNTFLGSLAGQTNTTGSRNSFFGYQAGSDNTTGRFNAFFGANAGILNKTGTFNTFIGFNTGYITANPTGDNNTLLGYAGTVISGVSNGTAIGAFAQVNISNALILGSINGVNGATADTNVGIGTTAPAAHLHIAGASNSGGGLTVEASEGDRASLYYSPNIGAVFDSFRPNDGRRLAMLIQPSGGSVGIGTFSPDQTLTVNGNASKPGGGSWAVFSDARLKTIKGRFTTGLQALLQVEPVRYEYRADNALGIAAKGEQIGLVAQTLQSVIPEAVTRNEQGYLLVNNDPVIWTMVNAIKEQQTEIAQLQKELLRLRASLVRKVNQRRHNPKRMQ